MSKDKELVDKILKANSKELHDLLVQQLANHMRNSPEERLCVDLDDHSLIMTEGKHVIQTFHGYGKDYTK